MKKKAELLLQHIKQNTDLSWNDRGEISLQGQTVKNSNLIDLVNDVLRQRKHVSTPTGWKTFATALSQTNVARDLIGQPERWKYIQAHMETAAKKEPSSSRQNTSARQSEAESTPKRHHKSRHTKRKTASLADWEQL